MAETKRVTSATDLDTSTTLDVSTLSSASRMATEPRSHVVSMKSARRIVGTVRPDGNVRDPAQQPNLLLTQCLSLRHALLSRAI